MIDRDILAQIVKHSNGKNEYYVVKYCRYVLKKGRLNCDKYGNFTKKKIQFFTLEEAKAYLADNMPYNTVEIVETIETVK